MEHESDRLPEFCQKNQQLHSATFPLLCRHTFASLNTKNLKLKITKGGYYENFKICNDRSFNRLHDGKSR
jgi:hypothetical protein